VSLQVDLSDKVVLITGARRGMGKAFALSFAERGASVVINDIKAEELSDVAETIKENNGKVLACPADITRKDQVDNMVSQAVNEFGRLDILVNAAAILRPIPFLDFEEDDWDATIAVNLKGTFLCGQAAARKMVAQGGGKIINVASNIGKVARMNNAVYCSSKDGVILLTRVMALELAKHSVTVNALCPGATETEMIMIQAGGNEKFMDGIIKGDLDSYRAGIPMGRLAKPEEQADMVLFLSSEHANQITGQTFFVDGGQTMV
jgi:NAD(P)-dependent dehydrogenase (short-subunit alcohol dehydrogenase family)